jgi:hypothetical protein
VAAGEICGECKLVQIQRDPFIVGMRSSGPVDPGTVSGLISSAMRRRISAAT